MSTPEERLARVESNVRGLAREVEATRTAQAGLADIEVVSKIGAKVAENAQRLDTNGERLEQTETNVADLAVAVKKLTAAKTKDPVLSWLTGVTSSTDGRMILADLIGWLHKVYLRYSDADLPECWLWHPEVIEELLWLRQAWRAAYQGEPSIRAVGDWHDRHRPGVIRRIGGFCEDCSLEEHRHSNQPDQPSPVEAPAADAAGPIADWWTASRDDAHPPEPTEQQISDALAEVSRRARHTGGKS